MSLGTASIRFDQHLRAVPIRLRVRRGAAGYLIKASAPEELVRAVRSVMQLARYISETIAATLVDYVLDDPTSTFA